MTLISQKTPSGMRVLLADDHHLVRKGLKPVFVELDPQCCFFEAGSLSEILALAPRINELDLILLDLFMPGMRGIISVREIIGLFPGIPVAILSGHVRREDVMEAMAAGAAGYISKTMNCSALLSALRLIFAGEKYFTPSVFAEEGDNLPLGVVSLRGILPVREKSGLSPRETEILCLITGGKTNKGIAQKLNIEEITVKVHVRAIYRKLGAANRAEAVRIAVEGGLCRKNQQFSAITAGRVIG